MNFEPNVSLRDLTQVDRRASSDNGILSVSNVTVAALPNET